MPTAVLRTPPVHSAKVIPTHAGLREALFLCTRGERCPSVDGDGIGVNAALKEAVRAAGLPDRIRINHAGCFSQCGNGPMAVVYPEGTWYAALTPEDAAEIVERHLVGASRSSGWSSTRTPWALISCHATRRAGRSAAAIVAGRRSAVSDRWPAEVADLLRDRTDARDAHDWPRADALRARLRELGWEADRVPHRLVRQAASAAHAAGAGPW